MTRRKFLTGNARTAAMATARSTFRGRSAAVSGGGGGLNIQVDSTLDGVGLAEAVLNRKFRVVLNRIMRNAGQRMVKRAKELSRPTWKTGAFASHWTTRLIHAEGALRVGVALENAVPYSGHVKRAGSDWHAGRTVVDKYIKPMVAEIRKEIDADIEAAAPEFTEAIAEGILSRRVA